MDREAFLAGIRGRRPRQAQEPGPRRAVERVAGGEPGAAMLERWREVGGTGELARAADAPARVTAALRDRGVRCVRLWDHEEVRRLDLAAALAAAGLEVLRGEEGLTAELEGTWRAQAGVVVASAGVASTGTMALVAGPGCPRATSLLPPTLVILCREPDIVDRMSLLWERLPLSGPRPPSNIALVTGPSSSADIESHLIRGVHGPGDVIALVLAAG